ncbi:BlaI/MecI/CopY family transcriptional regulator [Henriciella sp.]|uniref:BlaI/MecI/CopY family transcriptional regulator n=1 Tax=Henriciella sp. TaxID=1968823 RepID=UPI0026357B1D|nr:BlaI/MecI/CopY family transcriptional regulator [Henriciella sp.]
MAGQLKLGDLEVATLEAIWSWGKTDARDLYKHFSRSRGISLSTVQSTLERLHRKRLLFRDKVSHAYVYSPAESREAVMARLVDEALGRFRAKSDDGLLAAFAGITASATPETLDALEKLVREARLAKDEPE